MIQFLNDREDVAWLRSTALRRLDPPVFASFEIDGNEDCPDNVAIYAQVMPTVFEKPLVVYTRGDTGALVARAQAAINKEAHRPV
jgi:hypothetical protein